MKKILIVRLSSMGDVIHQLPAITDLARAYPYAVIDWVVEENFAELPHLHPAIRQVIPVALRRWRKSPLRPLTRVQWTNFKTDLRACRYDVVLDAQGLLKSAAVARLACGPVAGFDRKSIREPLASMMYQRKYAVKKDLHAIDRNRRLSASANGYTLGDAMSYGLKVPQTNLGWLEPSPYAVLLTATSRTDKEWAESNWVDLGRRCLAAGIRPVFPWGSDVERERAERLAQALPSALIAPKLSLTDAAILLAGSQIVVGVDTGLVHLAAAVDVPVVAIFCASEPSLTGVRAAGYALNLGTNGKPPSVEHVWDAVLAGLQA